MSQGLYDIPDDPQPPGIPPELRHLNQWLAYRAIRKPNGKINKPPIDAKTGKAGSSTNPATWSGYNLAAARSPVGAAFVLTADDPYVAVDLDTCVDAETGEIAPWAHAIVDKLPIYWEISYSGKGLRGIGRGVLPGDRCRTRDIEVYDSGRYVVMTGRTLPGHTTIRNCQRELTAWYRELFSPESPRSEPRPAILSLDDQDLVERLRRQRSGIAGRLLDGDLCGKTSPSEARFALAGAVCFYSDDVDQVARVLRGAPLWSAKDRDRDRDRKAAHDARQAVAKYSGPRYTPNRPPDPPPTLADRQPTGSRQAADEGDTCSAQLAEARQEIVALKQDRDTLIALLLNPYVSSSEKMAVAATIDRAIRKQPEKNGLVVLKPGEIANDWRPKPEPGQNTSPLNRDGSKPRMSRSSVKRTMVSLTKYGFTEAKPAKHPVEPKGREPYTETVWLVKPPASVADFLAPIALYEPADKALRKPRTIAPQCPECGVDLNVTTWTVTEMACPECGEVHREESAPRTVHPVLVIDSRRSRNKLSPVRSVPTTGDNLSPHPPPIADEPPDYWIPPDDQQRYRPRAGEGAGNDRWTA
jgi:predicted RNA-binding Zn-ribbon protein involved in translation (DUF1610 family)